MNQWGVPSTTLLPILPLVGAAFASPSWGRQAARRYGLAITLATLVLSVAVSIAWQRLEGVDVTDGIDPGLWLAATPLFVVDGLNSILLPFAAVIFAFVVLVQPNTDPIEASLRRVLLSEAVTLAVLLSSNPLVLALLWCVSAFGCWYELRLVGGFEGSRLFFLYMMSSCVLLLVGAVILQVDVASAPTAGCVLIAIAIMIRKGIAPLHSWLPESFARAPLSVSVLFNAPQLGAWVAIRLIAPRAPLWVLQGISLTSLLTAVYAAGMGLVQVEARRTFAWLFLSQSALILVGLESQTSIARAGGLSAWISSGLALSGWGMTIAALEARRGPLWLREFAGGYDRKPLLAVCFLVLGFASVGFPGTLGFAGQETLVHGVVKDFPHVGFAVLLASMLNGITVVRTYFILFCGRLERSRIPQGLRPREQIGFVALSALLVAGGLFPGPFVRSRSGAAQSIRRAAANAGGDGRVAATSTSRAALRAPTP